MAEIDVLLAQILGIATGPRGTIWKVGTCTVDEDGVSNPVIAGWCADDSNPDLVAYDLASGTMCGWTFTELQAIAQYYADGLLVPPVPGRD